MTYLLLLGLIVACALLWSEVRQLRDRVGRLEQDAYWRASPEPTPEIVPSPVARVVQSAAPAPAVATEPAREAPAEPEPIVADAPPHEAGWTPEPSPEQRGGGFEEMFGRKLPIWAGGATLAVAGFFVVKYSIDAGLLSPAIRVVLGLLFGLGLIGGAEAAHRLAGRVRDPRIPQALAGAGVATLYGSILAAANLYGMVGGGAAFVGLAFVTLLAGLLSLRFGPASAVLGLVGGLSAPALVGAGPPNMPLLSAYLALAVGGLCVLGRGRRWWWLGAGALVGGFGWGLALILAGVLDLTAAVSLGVYTLLIGVAFPLLLTSGPTRPLRWVGALAGCAQMAAIVATGGFAPLSWALYGLISIAAIWLSRRDDRLDALPAPALAIALLLATAWPDPSPPMLAAVIAGIALIYGLSALQKLWRPTGGLTEAAQISAIAIAIAVLPLIQVIGLTSAGAAPFALLGALIAGGAATLGWRGPRDDARFALLAGTAGALLALAAGLALPDWTLGPCIAIIAAGLLLLALRAGDVRVERTAWAFGLAAIVFLLLTGPGWDDAARMAGVTDGQPAWLSVLRWAIATGAAWLFVDRGRAEARPVGQVVAALLAYATAAQLLPLAWLPLALALALPALAYASRGRFADPALATVGALAIAWAALPFAHWAIVGLAAVAGYPAFAANLPEATDALTRLLAPALGFAALLWLHPLGKRERRIAILSAGALGLAGVHILYKQAFALADQADFVTRGMAERTIWEALLAALAVAAWRFGRRELAIGAGAVALAHFGWFTMLLHNPLWDAQLVGPWLLPAYGIARALLWAANRLDLSPLQSRIREWSLMALILLFGVSILRQIFHGPMLSAPGLSAAEDIARSVFAIAAAVAFLTWGIRHNRRDWRIASLALMLLAVGKVFLFDAAGLDGLLRIASFAALGFSLIGVGWLYSRYLPEKAAVA